MPVNEQMQIPPRQKVSGNAKGLLPVTGAALL
jgi:hypothetical protein